MFRYRALAASSVLLAVLGAFSLPASARPPDQTQPTINSWAVAPAGPNAGEPGSRPNFSYELAAGARITDSVAFFNYGNTALTFHIYATDAYNDPTGGFNLLAGDKVPTDVGSWVKMPVPNLTVAARTRADLPVTIQVPPDARPGDHAAAILASSTVAGHDSQGKVVNLDRRAGTRVYIRVAGPLTPQLTIENVKTTYHAALNPFGGSADLTYTIKNTGNVRLGAHQVLALKAPFGRRIKQLKPADIAELLPGNSVVVSAEFRHVTAVVRATGQVSATGFPVGAGKATSGAAVSRVGHTWAIPWTLLVLAFLATLAWQAGRRYAYWRQQRSMAVTGSALEVIGR